MTCVAFFLVMHRALKAKSMSIDDLLVARCDGLIVAAAFGDRMFFDMPQQHTLHSISGVGDKISPFTSVPAVKLSELEM